MENYVETAKQTLRQMNMIKTLSWLASLQNHTSVLESFSHMYSTVQEDHFGKKEFEGVLMNSSTSHYRTVNCDNKNGEGKEMKLSSKPLGPTSKQRQ